jgi:hypothetical protein
MRLLAYTTNDIISPERDNEPAAWHVTVSNNSLNESFAGIRLVASNGTATAGTVKWDEIRVARNWTNLFSAARAPVWKGSTGLLANQWINPCNWVGNRLPYQTNDTCVFYRSLPYTGDIEVIHLGSLYNYKGLKFNENADLNVNIRPVDYTSGSSARRTAWACSPTASRSWRRRAVPTASATSRSGPTRRGATRRPTSFRWSATSRAPTT